MRYELARYVLRVQPIRNQRVKPNPLTGNLSSHEDLNESAR